MVSKHDKGLEELMRKPHKIGIDKDEILLQAIKVQLMESGQTIGEVDYLVFTPKGIIITEYKTNYSFNNHSKASYQNRRNAEYLQKIFKKPIIGTHIVSG